MFCIDIFYFLYIIAVICNISENLFNLYLKRFPIFHGESLFILFFLFVYFIY